MVVAHVANDPLSRRSPFLGFVAKEFNQGRGTSDRLQLSDKMTAHEEVRRLGMRCPERCLVTRDLSTLTPGSLPDRCVLKITGGWSARGVMPLELLKEGLWFDHLALRTRTLDQIVKRQLETARSFKMSEPTWIIEEMVSSTIAGKPIPFDYKFYCFRDRIGLIVQIDRNVAPAQLCLLHEDFTPFTEGRDYTLGGVNAQPGQPVVPLNAPDLVHWAKLLSLRTDAPFVSVDLYDSPEGPVFGEYTFSPGGTHRAMFSYSEAMLGRLDALFTTGSEATMGSFQEGASDPSELPRPRLQSYARLAAGVVGRSSRAADRLSEFYVGAAQRTEEAQTDALLALARSWASIRDGLRAHQRRRVKRAQETASRWDTGQASPAPMEGS